ncbi:UNVERIFIED_CONTAM: hypothetical protein HDU68_004286 [Siphonaria sp. JEL0065]|nr:hypothetical protein HDU68_004286 [Siphonaria sp. JEL0065]
MDNIANSTHGSVSSVRYIAIPLPDSNKSVSLSSLPNSSFQPTIPTSTTPIKILQTQAALYRIISNAGDSKTSRNPTIWVEATLHSDGSVLRSDEEFTFVTLYVNESTEASDVNNSGSGSDMQEFSPSNGNSIIQNGMGMYMIDSPPDIARNWDTGIEYPVREIVLEMTRLYHLAYRYLNDTIADASRRKRESSPSSTAEVARRCKTETASVRVEGVGVFKAFSDSSVFVQFDHALSIRIQNCHALCGKAGLSGLERMEHGVDGALAQVTNSAEEEYNVRVFCPIGVER